MITMDSTSNQIIFCKYSRAIVINHPFTYAECIELYTGSGEPGFDLQKNPNILCLV